MKPKNKTCFFLFLLILVFSKKSFSQNIVNDTVYVSTTSVVEIIFNSQVDHFLIPNGDKSYQASVTGNNRSLLVTALKKKARDQPLIVQEGPREHKFILLFKENTAATRIDYSDLEKLAEHVRVRQALLANGAEATVAVAADEPEKQQPKRGKKERAAKEESETEKSKKAIAEANQYFKKGMWKEAKVKYLEVKDPDFADLATSRINDIDIKLKEQDDQTKLLLEKKYQQFMTSADSSVHAGNLGAAKVFLQQALETKPDDVNAANRLHSVEETEKDNHFKEFVAKGDKASKTNAAEDAAMNYEEALQIKPDDVSTKAKLTAVKKRANEVAVQRWRRKGDSCYEKKDLAGAKASYEQVKEILPNDTYVNAQLKKIQLKETATGNTVVTETSRADSTKKVEYNKAIASADKFYDAKDYSFAAEEYQRALRIYPNSIYPTNQLKKITQLQLDAPKDKGTNGSKNE